MKSVLNIIAKAIVTLALLDLLILATALAQIATEGRTGYWNSFWRWQAQQAVKLLQ